VTLLRTTPRRRLVRRRRAVSPCEGSTRHFDPETPRRPPLGCVRGPLCDFSPVSRLEPKTSGWLHKGPQLWSRSGRSPRRASTSRTIPLVRGERVILDSDLAELYGVETKALVQAVKRNISRFPADFMFQLTAEERTMLRSQSVTSGSWGGRPYAPYAFTEQSVAMLSSVLRSPRAIAVNIEIMRTFVRLRVMLSTHADLARKLAQLEKKYDSQFRMVFDAIRELMTPPSGWAPSRSRARLRCSHHSRVTRNRTSAGRRSTRCHRRLSPKGLTRHCRARGALRWTEVWCGHAATPASSIAASAARRRRRRPRRTRLLRGDRPVACGRRASRGPRRCGSWRGGSCSSGARGGRVVG
jgi:hypothetical protein